MAYKVGKYLMGSCSWCYQDNYIEEFTTYNEITFCGWCIQYHGKGSEAKLHKRYMKVLEKENSKLGREILRREKELQTLKKENRQ